MREIYSLNCWLGYTTSSDELTSSISISIIWVRRQRTLWMLIMLETFVSLLIVLSLSDVVSVVHSFSCKFTLSQIFARS